MAGLFEGLLNKRLPQEQESLFQRDMLLAPGWRDWRRDFMRTQGGPPNTDPGGDYNYRAAWKYGATPQMSSDGTFHGMSQVTAPPFADPVPLKQSGHPTEWKQFFYEQFGKDPDLLTPEDVTPEIQLFFSQLLGTGP